MEMVGIFAVACVTDMERSVAWYARLMGPAPDDRPMEGLVQWRSASGAGLQLVLEVEKSGSSLITIVTREMDLVRAQLAAATLQLEPNIQGDFGIIAQISDPDGNRVTLAEPPQGM